MRKFLDSPVIVFSVLLGLSGCLAIFNATFHQAHPYHFVYRQLIWLGIGTVAMLGFSSLRPTLLHRLVVPLSAGALLLLYLLLPLGETINGMRGWFRYEAESLAPFFSPLLLQPSELAKPLFVLFLVRVMPHSQLAEEQSWRDYLRFVALASLWLVPIFLQPDFGTLTVYLCTMVAVYWLQGGKLQHLLATGLGLFVALVVALSLHPYMRRRLTGFADPSADPGGAGWHILQFQATLANGGLTGSGGAVWSRNYLPLGYSDSIFATVAETVGFLGLLPVLLILVAWVLYSMRLARQQPERSHAVIVAGLGIMIAGQALLHVSVSLGLLPTTGITFPLLSYGGSSLVATMMALGMMLAHTKKGVPET